MEWIVRRTHAANGQPYGDDHKFMEGVYILDNRSGALDLIRKACAEWGVPLIEGESYEISPVPVVRRYTALSDRAVTSS